MTSRIPVTEHANDGEGEVGGDGTTGVFDLVEHLRDITAIQNETVRRLIDSDTPPLEMAAVLEDIANKFLDISDEIRDFALTLPEDGPEAGSVTRGEDAQA